MKKLLIIPLLVLAFFFTAQQARAIVDVYQGGTGLATSTLGDLLVGTSSPQSYTRLSIGSNGQVLGITGGIPTWVAASSGGGSSGTISTTTAAILGNLLAFGSPSAVYNIATSTLGAGAGLSSTGTLGTLVGGTNSTFTLDLTNLNSWTGRQNFTNATSTQLTTTGATYLLTAGGTLGIGTSTPTAYTTELSGGASANPLRISSTNASGVLSDLQSWTKKDSAIRFLSSTNWTMGYNSTSNDFVIGNGGNFPTSLAGSVQYLNISQLGNFGYGSTTPGSRFSIAGGAGATIPLSLLSTSTAAFATSTVAEVDSQGNAFFGLNGATFNINGVQAFGTYRATSGSIGGGVLTAGTCTSGTVNITGVTTNMVANATPVTYPGDGSQWDAYVSSAGVVTVKVCAIVALTPGASTYNVSVTP